MKIARYEKTHEYIKASWKKAVKKRDCDQNFVMPYDYIPPCVDGAFTSLFYWDTYFTNLGLYDDDFGEYAFNNIEDLKFCLRKFGCVPNTCRANGAMHASQPPLLFLMVEDYFDYSLDAEWLRDSYAALETEYAFWQTKRIAPNGLNRYWRNYDCETLGADEGWTKWYARRHGERILTLSTAEKIELQTQKTAEGEGGEDHTPRYGGKAADVNPIDLNGYLYGFEKTMARFAAILENGEEKLWKARAEKRLALLNEYCYDPQTGVYFDYNYKTGKRTGIYCSACYIPFVFGITKDRKALAKINERLIHRHGVSPCQIMPPDGDVYQWGYPNTWAPNNWWAYIANTRAGNEETAQNVVRAYLDTVSSEFEKSGKLYEKYDAVVGGKATVNEYGVPEMLGWTAGVFSRFLSSVLIKEK
ncbi:MAG: hypothetical protein IJ514_05820 [Clostridia bacterium]|nr:hypothetical protein [Clostridia bacterium]